MTEVTSRPIMESDQALQTALELSMQNLNNTTYSTASPDLPFGLFDESAAAAALLSRSPSKSQNITQCVPVPSSEHVAEIVGRQGCKIKALRAKTNTYIKTPVRGEDPVFVITGRPEDVSSAKREVLAAAEHFTQIRAARRSSATSPPNSFNSPVEERVSILVRVPYRVVGLVVGPKGATIKRIQQITNTYIVTPSRDKEPCFEVAGSPENVDKARKEIESYIAMRTGGSVDSDYESDYQALLSPNGSGMVDSVFSVPTTTTARKMSEALYNNFPQCGSSPTDPAPFSAGLDGSSSYTNAWSEKVRRTSPLSSAVFGGSGGAPDAAMNNSLYAAMPMSAPVINANAADSVFDFSRIHDALARIRPQPPSPTSSFESNSSEGTAAISPKQSPRLPVRHFLCCLCRDREVSVEGLSPCSEQNLLCYYCARQMEQYGGDGFPVNDGFLCNYGTS